MNALQKEWKQFKSGTDIRGVAVDGVEGEPLNLTDEAIERMTFGFVNWLQNHYPQESYVISVGHDSRISADRISGVVIKTLCSAGVMVKNCNLASTPAMFMTTVLSDCDAAVQITASHHPYHRNGLKFFTRNGGLEGSDIEEILLYAQEDKKLQSDNVGTVEEIDFMSVYAKSLCDKICSEVNSEDYEHPLKGHKIIVDAGNGVGGFFVEKVLKPLGADTTGSQFLEPDGMFPNHIPNPENEEAMASVCGATVRNGAELGIIFDTDVDRAGCVDANGNEINRNRLVALASCIALEGNDGGTIVTDSITSTGLKKFIENNLDGVHHRFKRGYKNVINEAIRLNEEGINTPLAIETSGHAALRENYFLDDGAYLITKILIKTAQLGKEGKSLDDLIADLEEPLEAKEIRMKIKTEDFRAYGEKVIDELEIYSEKMDGWSIAPDNREGIRVYLDKEHGNGWFLLRLSVHDPIIPVNIESDSEGGAKIIARQLYSFVAKFELLDSEPFKKYLEE